MDLYESKSLHDMIDSDMRHYGDNIFDNDIACSPEGLHSETITASLAMEGIDSLDSQLSNKDSWMSSYMYTSNISTDFDSLDVLLVNPNTAMPVSLSEPMMLTSPITVPCSVTDSVDISSPDVNESSLDIIDTSTSITVSLPIQVINTSSLSEMAEMPSHVSLTVDVPTPSPVSHNLTTQQAQQILTLHEADINENSDSPKPKSKNKTSKSNQQISNENAYPKPAYSYSCLIAMALKNSKTGSLPVNEIYDFMTENFPYFKTAPNGWKNSVRHNLSLNKCFEKIEKPSGNSAQRKGYLWAMNPAKVEKMEEELQKWGSKDPAAIRKSMANPERLELIEKGELKNTDSESEFESMNVSQVNIDTTEIKIEEGSVKTLASSSSSTTTTTTTTSTTTSMTTNDLLNNDFSSLSDSCLPELDLQKGLWEDLCGDRLSFLSDSPISSLSPKNSETMDDDDSLESAPSYKRSYVQNSHVFNKCAQRASSSSSTFLL